jgi:hypothetical protein
VKEDFRPVGRSFGDDLERELEPLLAEDHSIWIFTDGYYRSDEHPDTPCRDAATVAAHVNGPQRIVRQYHPEQEQR